MPVEEIPTVASSDDLERTLEEARARGRATAAKILSGSDMLSADAFAELLGTATANVEKKWRENAVLGLEGTELGARFPAWQVGKDGKPFRVLPRLFARLGGSAWDVYRFLLQPHHELDGMTGRDALYQGRSAEVLAVADSIAGGSFV